MVKNNYYCTNCGNEYAKWVGQCSACKEYNSVVEAPKALNANATENYQPTGKMTSLQNIEVKTTDRLPTKISQVDDVLGGGFVEGSLTLVGGNPGIGKSTLLLQIVNALAKQKNILYASGEENLSQIKMRADRLKIDSKFFLLNESEIDYILDQCLKNKIEFLIIDSIQTAFISELNQTIGSVQQIKAVVMKLMNFAKHNNVTTIIIGHVTKDGDIAGPKLLEHMVDTVIYLEGEKEEQIRIVRCAKNRFGTIDEIALLTMNEKGLVPCEDFNKQNLFGFENNQVGVSYGGTLEGNKPIFFDVQTLVDTTLFGNPKRSVQGTDLNKVNMLLAVITKRTSIDLSYVDCYVKIKYFLNKHDYMSDLAIAVSLISSKKFVKLPARTLYIGEVSLTGDIKTKANSDKLISEAAKLGFTTVVVGKNYKQTNEKIDVVKIKNIEELLKYLEM